MNHDWVGKYPLAASPVLPLIDTKGNSVAAMKLTQQAAENHPLEIGKTDQIFFDDAIPGFGVRVRQAKKWDKKWGGALSNQPPSRSWIFQYRRGAESRRMKIGEVSAIKVQAAREIARKLHAKVTLG